MSANGARSLSRGLTQRQEEVMTLLSQGLSNRQIGERLGISEQAVKAIVSRLLAKFQVRNRAGLIREAIATAPRVRSETGTEQLVDAGIVVFDAEGHVMLMNDRGAKLAGSYTPDRS